MKKNINRLLLFIAGLTLFFLTISFSGIENITLPDKISWLPVLGGILSTIFILAILAERWRIIVLSISPDSYIPRGEFYQIIGKTIIAGHLIPKEVADFGGRAIWLINKKGLPMIKAGSSILFDRLFDVWVLLITFPTAIIYFNESLVSKNFLIIIAIVSLSIIFSPIFFDTVKIMNFIFKSVKNIGFKFINHWVHRKLGSRQENLFPYLTQVSIAKIILFSIIKFLILSIRNVLFALAIFLNIPSDILIAGTPLSQATFIFSFTAGGLGVLEAGWLAILDLANQDPILIVNFILAQRFFTILCDNIASISVITFLSLAKKRSNSAQTL